MRALLVLPLALALANEARHMQAVSSVMEQHFRRDRVDARGYRLLELQFSHGLSLEDPRLEELVETAGLSADTAGPLIQSRLYREMTSVLTCTYDRIMQCCRDTGTRVLYVHLPVPGEHEIPFDSRMCLPLAAAAGMETMDLKTWWGRQPFEAVMLDEVSYHPTALGHRLIAESLAVQLRRTRDE